MYNYIMAIQVRIRKWGNSFGVVIPMDILKRKNLNEGEEVIIEVKRKESMNKIFGSLSDWKIDSQEFKNKIREEEK